MASRPVIEYYFSFISLWSYIGSKHFHHLAKQHNAHIIYKPVDLMHTFSVSGGLPVKQRSPQRQAYRLLEMKRWCQIRNIPIVPHPKFYPTNPSLAHRVFLAGIEELGNDHEAIQRFAHIGLQTVWADEGDIADPETIARIASEAGLDGERLLRRAQTEDSLAEQEATLVREIDSRRYFGAPVYVYRDEPFWGQDRLEMLDDVIKTDVSMAFRLPTHAPPRRQTSYSTSERPVLEIDTHTSQHQQQLDDDSKEWILFSPSQAASTTTRTRSDSTERTARTAGVSRLSDFGSFNAVTQADSADSTSVDALDEEATELDSLDDGLPDFRENILQDSNDYPVLPTHDGLGSFHASGQQVQEQLWRYEQYNPRRSADAGPTRRSSLQNHLETVDELESLADRERWQRIEKWRTEQSRILLQEIERETRRRQRRNSRGSVGTTSRRPGNEVLGSISETKAMDTSSVSSDTASSPGDSQKESIWRRITRKVIRDLMGIDESILSVILGESLVDDVHLTSYIDEESHPDIREMQEAIRDVPTTSTSADDHVWQQRLIERIARELGVLVHQIWEHPGAFSTYLCSDDPSEYYAGIPVTTSQPSIQRNTRTARSEPPPPIVSEDSNILSISSPQFRPTLQQDSVTAEHVAQWGIDDNEIGTAQSQTKRPQEPTSTSALANPEYEYWEQDLDVTMIFRYLKNRFRRGDNNGNINTATSTSHSTNIYNEQDASNRAAVIRQHHPLVARAHARSQARQLSLRAQMRAAGISTPTSPISHHHHHHHNQTTRFGRRPSSSCASQSTKVSARRTHTGLGGSGSSRHYWDIGGSVGSGSAAVSVGRPAGVGTWGEV
ncbi:conserved hypothetical protein [Talaromyces stipitatus ATCC 10500]|uniref:DSBA-like thioredoxin domain-containing protein n=1 Tax=Talaromyces stipitatus (strain ATCC 10500 / CBS 375.48 / QM 6759 / NRRL 1006) TaxID=441959 RepID=B8LYV8_TALSN|nr:uncharacterized protein TSTA_068900 [Talaromyces stipitatus ATCC 10500]EED23466.1 conserved hypothetical protein [Talaromyces stipitatus ATCC 10500]